MVFSTTVFMFVFLPLALLIYYLLRSRWQRNLFLALASVFAYTWGDPASLVVLALSILVNWVVAPKVAPDRPQRSRKAWLVTGLVFNVGMLAVFKYASMAVGGLNAAFRLALPMPQLLLPLGISYFTFMAISYLMDVYRGIEPPQRSLLNVCLYLSLFTKIVQGPIVRYQTFAPQIENRQESLSDFTEGARRFMVGLAKKVIIADGLALMVNHAYALPNDGLSTGVAWFGAIFFHVQVFYDFVGYSDMAIGLSRMFGFHFLENFNYPMLAKSVSDFWRRWHISLSTWFRDYVFFPLGGSRVKSKLRLAFNMLVVWSLTGLWHGANWGFLLWGFGFAVVLIMERFTGLNKWMEKRWIGYVYSNLVVVIITVFLSTTMYTAADANTPALLGALQRLGAMFGIGATGLWDATAGMYVREYGVYMLLAVIFSMPVGEWMEQKLRIPHAVMETLRAVGVACAFIVSLTFIAMGGYNPYVYVNF